MRAFEEFTFQKIVTGKSQAYDAGTDDVSH